MEKSEAGEPELGHNYELRALKEGERGHMGTAEVQVGEEIKWRKWARAMK